MSVSLRENITAVIESCFSETKEEIQEVAINNILELIRNNTADRKTENSSEIPNNSTISKMEQVEDEPQRDCFLCKWLGEVDVCGRCRNRNLFCEAELQPRCPNCGKRGYIRSLESMGVKLKHFDEYKWKCTNCNKYFKEEPKDEPQTEEPPMDEYYKDHDEFYEPQERSSE